MQATVRTALFVVLACACHTSGTNVPDGGDNHQDSGLGPAGLSVPISIQPATPGPVANGVTVDEVTFKLASLRVAGDAGQVATPSEIDLTWKAGVDPPQTIVFDSAPTGLYSKETLRIDGQLVDNSYWINGTATVNGTTYPFKIYDRNYIEIYLYGDAELPPGGSAQVPLLFELDHALDSIDWTLVDNDNGTLVLDTYDAYMPTFRAKVSESFVVKSPN